MDQSLVEQIRPGVHLPRFFFYYKLNQLHIKNYYIQ